ncbi:CRTAC1 family protein, partial [bacterium]|nr:CRTAC1 family protein [bacterium]
MLFLPCIILACLGLSACPAGTGGGSAGGGAATYSSEPLAAPSAGAARVLTALSPAESGIDFTNQVLNPQHYLDQSATQAGGAAGDYDGDGDTDFYVCGLAADGRLYRNDGALKFTDVSAEAGISGQTVNCAGAVFADFDSDKDLDLYVCCRIGRNLLYINDGSGKFTEEGEARGVASSYSTVMAAVFDAENDGDLDMYLCNNNESRQPEGINEEDRVQFTMEYRPDTGEFILPPDMAKNWYTDGAGKLRVRPDPDELLINDGTGKFSNQIDSSGMGDKNGGWELQALPADYNNDGLTDLWVSGDFDTPERLYINQGGGKFSDEAQERLRVTSYFSMGSDTADLNSDGWLDVFCGDMSASGYKDGKKQSGDMHTYRWDLTHNVPQQQMRNSAFLNRGDGWFSECAEMLGVKSSDWTWTCRIADINCDGLQDIYTSNGFVARDIEVDIARELGQMRKAGASEMDRAKYLQSLGGFQTDDVIWTATAPLKFDKAPDNWGMKDAAISCGVLLEDFDGDGDQDFLSNNTDSPTVLWRNDVAEGQRLVLRLRSDSANTQGVGARVTAWVGDAQYCNEVILSRGWATGCSSDLYIGLGTVDKVDKLTIRWPDLSEQTIENMAAGFRYTITQPKKLPKWQPAEKPAALFAQQDFDWEQKERETGDTTQAPGMPPEFTAEQLLPAQRSQLGTGCAVT